MASSYASNAILAKALSMYGNRLSSNDYSNLLACNNVREVALYLKNYTNYSEVLTDLNENDVHRGQLEVLLKKKIFLLKLPFKKMIQLKQEALQLLRITG